eukprot:169015_1
MSDNECNHSSGDDIYDDNPVDHDEEKKDEFDVDIKDDEDDYQECIINPKNDRRVIICDSQNKDNDIIKCIGSLEVHFIPDSTIMQDESIHGTGTVIYIDSKNIIYVLTAAHNVRAVERKCAACDTKTLRRKCKNKKCDSNPRTEKTGNVIEPQDIFFNRRGNGTGNGDKLGQSIERYQAEKYKIPDKYPDKWNAFATPKGGFDICIISFKCHDRNGIQLYKNVCSKIKLMVNDETFGDHSSVYIYGYPGHRREVKNHRTYYYLYGMGTSKINAKNKFTVATNSKTNKKYIVNECIDTTVGQSGSCIYSYHHNDTNRFLIYGVHTGGSPVQKPKPCNFGTFLDVDTMSWIKNVLIEFGAENMGNINKFIVKESNGQFKPISTSTNKVHNKMFGMDGKNGLLARVVLGKNIVYCAPKPMKMKGNVPKKSKNKYDVKCQLVKDQKALKIVKVFAAFD